MWIPGWLSRYIVTSTLLLRACRNQSFGTPSALGCDEEIVLVIDVKKPPIPDAVYHPDGSSICSSIVHSAPVVLKPALGQGDFVSAFQRIPYGHPPA
jgi:hypothetical protein